MDWETTKGLNYVHLLSVLMYLAHWLSSCNFWANFSAKFGYMLRKCKVSINNDSKKFLTKPFFYGRAFNTCGF